MPASSLMGAGLVAEGKLKNGFIVKFTGCKTFLNGTLSAECAPHSAGAPAETGETKPLKGLIVLHTGKVKLVVTKGDRHGPC
jgi:hypothetical protein